MALDFKVNLSVDDASQKIYDEIVNGSFSGDLIDEHIIKFDENKSVSVTVYDKFYHRAGNRLTLTVTIDNLGENTKVHCIGGGGGDGFFKFSWFADESFENCVERAIGGFIIK